VLNISIASDVNLAIQALSDLNRRHVPFAQVLAMTMTANDVKRAEYEQMNTSFDRPKPWTLRALRTVPATRSRPMATVDYKEGTNSVPASRFLIPNIEGGPRSQKSHELAIAPLLKGYSYLVPSKYVKLDAYGNMPASELRRIVSQLGVSRNADANASGSKKSKRGRKMQAYFVSPKGNMVLRRHSPHTVVVPGKTGKAAKGRTEWMIEPVLVGVRSPQYKRRFPFFALGKQVVANRSAANFRLALDRAIATGRFKGGWRPSVG